MEANPVGYWTLDGHLENEVSETWTLEIMGPDVSLRQNAVHFKQKTDENSCLRSTELLQFNGNTDYTIGMWVKPAYIHYATLAALCGDRFERSENRPQHLSVIK